MHVKYHVMRGKSWAVMARLKSLIDARHPQIFNHKIPTRDPLTCYVGWNRWKLVAPNKICCRILKTYSTQQLKYRKDVYFGR